MKLLAVTSCPVGMPHTYMAAAALKKAAKKLGCEIKVETQGSMGIRDKITPEEITAADIFIDAADVTMTESERFSDIYTVKTSTSKLLRKSVEILKEAIESKDK